MINRLQFPIALVATALLSTTAVANSNPRGGACAGLPSHSSLQAALSAATTTEDSGFNLQMWGTIVNRDGDVCAVAFTGTNRGAQWPGSRVISAQKANTANAFSLDSSANSGAAEKGLALSTANLFTAVQPGGSLFGLQESNPVNTSVAYKGPSSRYGTAGDPMVGQKIGGINVFGGGVALYNSSARIVGALGVSGDTSCTDHAVAWRTRHALILDYVPAGVSSDSARKDNMVQDIAVNTAGGTGVSAGGFGHPVCVNNPNLNVLPANRSSQTVAQN